MILLPRTYNGGIARVNHLHFWTSDGSSTQARLLDQHGNPVLTGSRSRKMVVTPKLYARISASDNSPALLYTTQRTNILYPSSDITNTTLPWNIDQPDNTTVTRGVTDPGGGTLASRYTTTLHAGGPWFGGKLIDIPYAGQALTFSVYLRGVNGGEQVCLTAEMQVPTYARLNITLTTSWTRYCLPFTANPNPNTSDPDANNGNLTIYSTTDATQSFEVYGAMVEVGTFTRTDEIGPPIGTTNAANSFTDHSYDAATGTVTFPSPPSAGRVYDWTGIYIR